MIPSKNSSYGHRVTGPEACKRIKLTGRDRPFSPRLTLIRLCFFAVGLGALVASLGAIKLGRSKQTPLPIFDPVLQQGDTKVTLLQVTRVTTFSSEYLHDNPGHRIRAIPGIEVLYRLEWTGTAPPGDEFHRGSVKVFSKGKLVLYDQRVVAGGMGTNDARGAATMTGFSIDFGPTQERTKIHHKYLRGINPQGDRVDLEIHVGFDQLQVFRFNDVPLFGGPQGDSASDDRSS